MNELQTTVPADRFRAVAADRLRSAADMTLHQLVDEFQRLTLMIEGNIEGGAAYAKLNAVGELAARERSVIVGTAKARFGIAFYEHDRAMYGQNGEMAF